MRKKKGCVLCISCLITVLVWMICYRHSYMLYMTNDDMSIQNLLNGFQTGQPNPNHQFINIYLGVPIAFLYRLIPNVQWWYVYSQFLMLVGIFLTNYVILTVGTASIFKSRGVVDKLDVIGMGACVVITGFASFIYNVTFAIPAISSTAFTVVPGIYGGGLIALLFLFSFSGRTKWSSYAIIVFLFIPVFLHRNSVGYVILCYLFLTSLYSLLNSSDFKKTIITCVVFSLLSFCVMTLLLKADGVYKTHLNGEEFMAFNSARSGWLDHGKILYDDNPELYEAAGWGRDTYVTVSHWCFVDERCTTDSLKYLAQHSRKETYNPSLTIQNAMLDLRIKKMIHSMLLFLAGAALVLCSMRDIRRLVLLVFDANGTLLLLGYQVVTGRIIYRSVVVVIIPAFVFMGLLVLSVVSDNRVAQKINRKIAPMVATTVCCVSALLFMSYAARWSNSILQEFINIDEVRTNQYTDMDDEINQYIMAHKDNFYVMQVGIKASINPGLIYRDSLSNAFYWGGSDYYSRARQEVLEKNGFDALTSDTFLESNVLLISDETCDTDSANEDEVGTETMNCLSAFCHYMNMKHPNYAMVKVDEIYNGMNVYQFILEE